MSFLKNVAGFMSKNSPMILTCMAAIGAVSTLALAVKATPRALDHIYDKEDELDRTLTWKEMIQVCWKDYIPTAVSAGATLACIFGARFCSYRQQEALASSYLLAHMTLQEYERVVAERLGEGKARDIREEVRTNVAELIEPRNELRQQDAIYTGHGNSLFYDYVDRRYFYSDIHFLEHTTNKINERLFSGHEPYIDLNEILLDWGLPTIRGGDEFVVTPERPLVIHITPDPERMENGDVRILFDYEVYPKTEALGR